MAIKQYPLIAPERWDNIANLAYGDPGNIEGIIAINPDVLITAIIPAGTILNIPIVEQEDLPTPATDLPPWLQ